LTATGQEWEEQTQGWATASQRIWTVLKMMETDRGNESGLWMTGIEMLAAYRKANQAVFDRAWGESSVAAMVSRLDMEGFLGLAESVYSDVESRKNSLSADTVTSETTSAPTTSSSTGSGPSNTAGWRSTLPSAGRVGETLKSLGLESSADKTGVLLGLLAYMQAVDMDKVGDIIERLHVVVENESNADVFTALIAGVCGLIDTSSSDKAKAMKAIAVTSISSL